MTVTSLGNWESVEQGLLEAAHKTASDALFHLFYLRIRREHQLEPLVLEHFDEMEITISFRRELWDIQARAEILGEK